MQVKSIIRQILLPYAFCKFNEFDEFITNHLTPEQYDVVKTVKKVTQVQAYVKKKDERQFKLRQLLQEHPKIKISDLSDYFQTSSETIRKDIIELEDSKIIKKEHGYALLLEEPDEMPISLRNQEYIEEKKQIMRQTCTFIKEGMVVYLDAGSTCQAGIPFLHPFIILRL